MEDQALQPAKDQFADSVDDLAASLKRHAVDAVAAIGDQIKLSARDASRSLSHEVTEMADSFAEGIRTVKSQFGVPSIIKENPWTIAIGGLGIGLGLLALRGRRGGQGRGRGITSRLAMLGVEVGLAYWLAQRRNREVSAKAIEGYRPTPPALH